MTKQNPKMILNLSIDNNELEEKIKIAMDKYAEQLIAKNLDGTIAKIVERRIDNLVNGGYWDSSRKINGVTLDKFVQMKTEKTIEEAIEKNAKDILAKKLASLL